MEEIWKNIKFMKTYKTEQTEIYVGVVGPVRVGESTFISDCWDRNAEPRFGGISQRKI